MVKVNKQTLFGFFVVLYAIMPFYFVLAGIRFANIMAFGFVILWIVINGGIKKVNMSIGCRILLFLWITWRSLVLLYHGELSRLIVFGVSTVGIGLVTLDWVNSKEKFLRCIDVLIWAFAIVGVLGVLESVTGINVFAIFNNSGIALNYNGARLGVIRIISFTGQTINYCLCCAMMATLTIYRMSTIKSLKHRRRLLLVYGLLVLNIVLTLSRSIILCFIISQLILFARFGIRKLLRNVTVIIAITLIISSVWSLVGDESSNMIAQFIYMLLAVFDDRFAEKLASNWGAEDTSGVGDRFILYKWVWNTVKDNLVMGFGSRASFQYTYQMSDGVWIWNRVKNGIEVNYLNMLFRYGVIGLITECAMYLYYAVKSCLNAFKKYNNWERKINYNYAMFVILIMNFMAWFAVSQSAEEPILYFAIFLMMAYNGNRICDAE